MTKEFISVKQLHKIVNTSDIRKIRLVEHEVFNNRHYDVWIVEYPDQRGTVRYYTPQA